MSAAAVVPIPVQSGGPVECHFGHLLNARNTALDMDGTLICLVCVALVNESADGVIGLLVAAMLNLAPMPSRKKVTGDE